MNYDYHSFDIVQKWYILVQQRYAYSLAFVYQILRPGRQVTLSRVPKLYTFNYDTIARLCILQRNKSMNLWHRTQMSLLDTEL